MSRLAPLPTSALTGTQREQIDRAEALMGFTANDALIMARNPALTDAFGRLVAAVYAPGQVDAGLKRLIGMLTSAAAGCEYCTGHTAFASQRHGVDAERIRDAWNFESSDRFSAAEKAALRVAFHAGQTPNAVTDAMFAEFAGHYDEQAQLEVIAVIAMFGFLNRWNSTLRTDLEALPAAALATVQLEQSTGDT